MGRTVKDVFGAYGARSSRGLGCHEVFESIKE